MNTDKIDANVNGFLDLCPYASLKDKAKIFQCDNGSVIIKWDCLNKSMAVNIGLKYFSACIVDTKNMKSEYTLEGTIDDKQAIRDFFYEVGKWFGYAKVSYCIENKSSTGFVNNNQTIIIGVLHD